MQKSFKDLPDFATEDEERAFWATHDSTDYIDWSTAVVAVFPQLKRTNMLSADSGNELNGFTADHPFPK